MAIFSDIDWVILLAVGAFLLFGRGNAEVLRTLGRWYGRAGRLKQELLSEFTKAADLPGVSPGAPLTIRGALLGLDPVPTRAGGIPTSVTTPPRGPFVPETGPWTGGYPIPTWTMTPSLEPSSVEVSR